LIAFRRPPAAHVKAVIAWTAAVPCALWAVMRLLGVELGYPQAPALSYTVYVIPVAVVTALAAGAMRQWVPAALAMASAVTLIALVAPRAVGGPDEDLEGRSLKVMSSNVLRGSADPEGLVGLVREHEVEVLAVQEVTSRFAEQFEARGGDDLLPHAVLEVREGVSGNAVYSRYPLTPLESNVRAVAQTGAEVALPDGSAVEAVSVHPQAPLGPGSHDTWNEDIEALPEADPRGVRRLLIGDFNSGFDQSRFRDLVDSGYLDAAERMGEGLKATWPARDKPFRYLPVVLDHVLYDERLGVRGFDVFDLPGSDHRTIYAELIVPD
jgi:endonuclease/exonuclease/phosphatase (EEP) superfamily protein YafD